MKVALAVERSLRLAATRPATPRVCRNLASSFAYNERFTRRLLPDIGNSARGHGLRV
jgi:hypothetical protein